MTGYERITRAQFYNNGGHANPRLVRMTRGRCWAYYRRTL